MQTEFRNKLAERAISAPTDTSAPDEFQPHPELVRIATALRDGVCLKEIAIRAWTFQDRDKSLRVHEAARFRTIFRRIHRFLNMQSA